MTDDECTAFLQWALPRLGRRWAGYRKVRRLACKRLGRRLRVLGLADLAGYRRRLESHPEEWTELDALLGIPISRFYRDRGVFEAIEREVLPALARAALASGRTTLECWSAGCAAGEEPYTLAILWQCRLQPAFPNLALRIVATDRDDALLDRARTGCYGMSSLKELPSELRAAAFEHREGHWCIRPEYRRVEFMCRDLRDEMPAGLFDLVLCRNALATYYAPDVQRDVMLRMASGIRPGGALVLGIHESVPESAGGFVAWRGTRAVFRRTPD